MSVGGSFPGFLSLFFFAGLRREEGRVGEIERGRGGGRKGWTYLQTETSKDFPCLGVERTEGDCLEQTFLGSFPRRKGRREEGRKGGREGE